MTCARAGRDVTLWERDAGNAEQLATERESRFLPGVRLDDGIAVTRDLAEAARADAILLVVPAQAMRSVVAALAPTIAPRHAGDRLRQGHRARHAQVHDRDHRRMRAEARCRRSCRGRASPPTWRAACRPR